MIRLDVNLVQVDAVVTDSKNKHVGTLKAEDFVILQDGKPQKITNFSYIAINKPVAAAAPVARCRRMPEWTPAPPHRRRSRRMRSGCTFALVVDDLGLSFTSIAQVHDALRKFVDQQMQPGDLVAIIRTRAGLGVLQQFTSDKNLLHAAIDRVKFAFGRVGVDSFAPVDSSSDPRTIIGDTTPPLVTLNIDADLESLRTEMFTVGSLGAIQYVIDGSARYAGTKSRWCCSPKNMQLYDPGGHCRVATSRSPWHQHRGEPD